MKKQFSRKINGKRFQLGATRINKTEAKRRAEQYKSKGFLVRVIPSAHPYTDGYSVYWRGEPGHGY